MRERIHRFTEAPLQRGPVLVAVFLTLLATTVTLSAKEQLRAALLPLATRARTLAVRRLTGW